MILFFLATLLSAVFCLADAPSDTLYVKRWGKPLNGPILVSAGAKSTDVPVGVWRHPNNKSTAGTILWFHGGMTSGNCQKGLVAGSDLAKLLPKYTIVSASACKQNHWVDESTIQSVDNALDSLAKRSGKKIDEARRLRLPILETVCPYAGRTERQSVRDLLGRLRGDVPDLYSKVLNALENLSDEDRWGA